MHWREYRNEILLFQAEKLEHATPFKFLLILRQMVDFDGVECFGAGDRDGNALGGAIACASVVRVVPVNCGAQFSRCPSPWGGAWGCTVAVLSSFRFPLEFWALRLRAENARKVLIFLLIWGSNLGF